MEKFTITPQHSVMETMKLLSQSPKRILFVQDSSRKLIGSVTDGDIRRALINGEKFESPISNVMCDTPHFVRKKDPHHKKRAWRYLSTEGLQGVPILDEGDHIVGTLFPSDFRKSASKQQKIKKLHHNPVVIMSGGKGTRLDPFTKILPKPLIPVGDKPIIEKIMDNFHKSGFHHFILTLNYKKEFIKAYFKDNYPAYRIEWVEEQDFLGTAGPLSLLKDKIKEPFIVTNCDIILQTDFSRVMKWHKEQGAAMTLIGHQKEVQIPYGTLEVKDDQLVSFTEKPRFDFTVNSGIYILDPDILQIISENTFLNMNHLIERISLERKVSVFPCTDYWFDLGEWSEYKRSLSMLKRQSLDTE